MANKLWRQKKTILPGPASAHPPKSFLIVGIGASAGGFEAFTQLLHALPNDTGMAFVFVQHLDPKHESKLAQLFARSSTLPILSIESGMRAEPNKVYVLPENCLVEIENGCLKLLGRTRTTGQHLPVDSFFHSLAHDQGNCAVGIVLSGGGSDGTLGLREIKAEGGITFAQDQETSAFFQMPSSAINTGCVDFILPPDLIAKELVRITKHPAVRLRAKAGDELLVQSESELTKIFTLLRGSHFVDFSHYKHNTLRRRILRRMVLRKIEGLSDYTNFLRQHPDEVDALFQDLLINVTAFFRDARLFQTLQKSVFPKLLKQNAPDTPLRIWVPGCSSGEEVYSLAITFFEFFGRHTSGKNLQIFATDICDSVLAKARAGFYPESIKAEVSAERLRRFFHKKNNGYQISKSIRDCCVFARQNVIEDPPFSKVDLISCRNVLIYFGPVLQKKIIPIFNYALNKNGYLILGSAETIGLFSDMFTLVDNKNKIFIKRDGVHPTIDIPLPAPPELLQTKKTIGLSSHNLTIDLLKQVDRALLSQYAPCGVLISAQMEVLQFRGRTSDFIEPSPGEASLNIMKLVRPDLADSLRIALSQAIKMHAPVRKDRIALLRNGKIQLVNLQIMPVPGALGLFLVLFENGVPMFLKPHTGGKSGTAVTTKKSKKMDSMTDELRAAKGSLHSVIEEQEATNEELKSANEEIQSSNEELQSTNEQLETAKEELQSTNEELITLNEELQTRNVELSRSNDDMNNLLGSVSMPILMLGNDLTIRRFTPLAERLFNLISTDIGRRISDLNTNIRISNLDKIVSEVIDTLRTQEHEVQDRDGRWYSMRVRPYRTVENRIEGVVVLLIDINELKRGLEEITSLIQSPLLTLRGDLQVHKANDIFYKHFKVSRDEADGKSIYQIDDGAWNFPAMKTLLEGALPDTNRVENYEIVHTFPKIGRRKMLFNGRRLYQPSKGTQLILLAIDDVTNG